ncbi:MAG: DUF2207 domain-containing protein [Candidatus Korobacteraceae bacterium]
MRWTAVNSRLWRAGWLLAALLLAASSCWARTWSIARFDGRYTVADDGSVLVEEEIHPSFEGTFNGIDRYIPVEYPGPDGTDYKLLLNVESVTDENGDKIRYEQSSRSEQTSDGRVDQFLALRIYAGGTDTERTIRITYKAANAVRFFKDHDEFYWNVTGNDWEVPIAEASAFVALPGAAAGKGIKAQAFTGAFGGRGRDASSSVDGSNISFTANDSLGPRNGLTIDVYIPKGVLTQPSWFTNAVWFVQGNPGALLPVWALAVMFGLWWWKGRDPDPGLSVAPMYEPPKGLTPAEAGTLLEDAVEARDITSTVIDLAVKGYIKIIEQNDKVLFITHRDYVLKLVKPRPEWQGLAGHELVVLDNIFPLDTMVSGASDTETTLSSLKERFYIALPSIRQQIMEALDSKNLYATDPDSAKGLALVGVLVIVLPFLWLQMTGRISLFNSPTVLAAGVVLSVVIVALFGRRLAAKTVRGARARVECLGFKEFMTRVDGDRIKRMPPDTFEKFLPYAMAFGVEHHWAKAFEGLLTEPPAWYVGSGYGTPGMLWTPLLFASAMNTFSSSAYQSFSAAPQASSSGSGFGSGGFDGGGGFSGGGFGGGGGDAF